MPLQGYSFRTKRKKLKEAWKAEQRRIVTTTNVAICKMKLAVNAERCHYKGTSRDEGT